MAGYTNVYVSSALNLTISVVLSNTGPGSTNVYLNRSQVQPQAQSVRITQVPRMVSGLYTLDIAFSCDTLYFGSLGVLIGGHGFGSSMWYRYRSSGVDVLPWVSDRDDHSFPCTEGATPYSMTVAGKSAFLGYDDIVVSFFAPG